MLALLLLFIITLLSYHHLRHNHAKRKNQIFFIYIAVSILTVLGILHIKWTDEPDFNLFLTFSLLWLTYIPILLIFAHKEGKKTHIHKARMHFGKHVSHLTDEQLHHHLKHNHRTS